MFLRKSRTFLIKSVFCSNVKRFCHQQTQSFVSKVIINPKLLYPFSQSQTSKALNIVQEASPGPSSIVILDKLSATDYSQTYRAYNIENKIFVAQKNIHLDSPASWNQANLILRQQQASLLFGQTLSIEYDERRQNMKVMSDLQNTILKDYSQYLQSYQSIWLKERIKFYIVQIIQQLNALKKLGIELEGRKIDPQKIFIEKTSQELKLYDLSDFRVNDSASEADQNEFFEIAKRTLISLSTGSREESEIEAEIQNLEIGDFHKIISQFDGDFEKISGSEGYDRFIFDKILRVLKEKESLNTNEGEDVDLLSDLRIMYKKHAEIYKSKGDFKSAVECYEKIIEIEGIQGQTRENHSAREKLGNPKTDSFVATSLSGKLTVLTMKVVFFFLTFTIAFILFGLIVGICFYGYFHLFNIGNNLKQEEKEDKD